MRTRIWQAASTLAVTTSLLGFSLLRDASAQTPFVPYFGKNQVRYDTFDWHIYTTEHFEIYYYPQLEQHLERVASYAESAYQQVSADLKHDLSFKVPLIVFKTHSEFEEQNVIPGASQEGVLAFAEPYRDRVVLPIDEPPDRLYGVIVHELTHIFEFDIIPRSLVRRGIPLWVDEGLADYERGTWLPLDLMTVRDAAVADIVPNMTDFEGSATDARLVYNLGHAVFEFIESRWGKEGIRQYLFALRKSVIGGGEDAYDEAFKMKPDEFDQEFEKYLKDRFKPFRDKERPADYGRNLAPDGRKTEYREVLSIEPSPSGDLLAAVTINQKDRELDVILVSTKDGQIVRNLTSGFDKDRGFEYIAFPSNLNTVAWLTWSPKGDRLGYFVRTEKHKTLVLQNVLTRKIEHRVELTSVDEPSSPNISPDGRMVAFDALRGAVGDVYTVNLETLEITNVTNDDFADFSPTFAPDGKSLIYLSRVSGNFKLFRYDLETKKKTQLTFGTQDEASAKFIDADTIVFSSTATDPNQPLEPEVARNGNIFNIWTLSLKTGELRQYTDALSGNLSPVVLGQGGDRKIAFVAYYKGEYSLRTLDRSEPLHAATSSDFGAPGPIIDFQAPLTHTLLAENKKKKGKFDKMFLEGRPPVNVGVTSGGDVYGGSEVTFSDVLGDQQFNIFAASIAQYRTLSFSYGNLSKRLQYFMQGFSQTQFFYGQLGGVFYDPVYAGLIGRDDAIATRTVRGGSLFGIYPLNRYRRIELSGGLVQYREEYNDPGLQAFSEAYQQDRFGQQVFRNGTFVPLGVAFVQETTVFREFGPLTGSTMRVGYDVAPKIGNTLSRQTVDADLRYYARIGTSGVFAVRGRGFTSFGEFPDFLYFGGNSELRGYQYLEFVGQKAAFANAELRFPIIEAALTPIGVVGGVRGVFFFNVGGAGFKGQPFTFATSAREVQRAVIDTTFNADGTVSPVYGPPTTVSGFRLKDGRASYGIGLETFALGFPIHFDWSWRTLFNRGWEDILYSAEGGSSNFRKAQFSMWIGYDF